MPLVAGPYGMEAVNSLNAAPNNLASRQFLIDPANSTGLIYGGDVAKIVSSGYVTKDTGTTTLTPCGVFTGFEYTNAVTRQRVQSEYFPGSGAVYTTDPIYAYVNDDPNTLFKIQLDATISTLANAVTIIGSNMAIVQTAGNATFGRSQNAGSYSSIATTSTLPLRIIAIPRFPGNSVFDASSTSPIYYDVLVKFNNHQYTTLTGT